MEDINTEKDVMEELVGYKEMRMRYACALKEIRTKFEVLNTEFSVRYQRNPIDYISTRLKSNFSLLDKLKRYNVNVNVEDIENNIFDIAGIRIICSYTDDIYLLADALAAQDDIKVITVKDYIKNPKPNGYRSLHMIVEVPVFFASYKKPIKVEVQIRTIAMDYWASLEHSLKYKKEIKDQEYIVSELKKCADTLAMTESKMIELRRKINCCELDVDSPIEEKIKRIDSPIM